MPAGGSTPANGSLSTSADLQHNGGASPRHDDSNDGPVKPQPPTAHQPTTDKDSVLKRQLLDVFTQFYNVQAELRAARDKLQSEGARTGTLESELKDGSRKATDLSRRVEQLEEQVATLERDKAELKASNTKLHEQVEDLEEKKSMVESIMRHNDSERDDIDLEMDDLRKQLADAKEHHGKLQSEKKDLVARVENFEKYFRSEMRDVHHWQATVARAKRHIESSALLRTDGNAADLHVLRAECKKQTRNLLETIQREAEATRSQTLDTIAPVSARGTSAAAMMSARRAPGTARSSMGGSTARSSLGLGTLPATASSPAIEVSSPPGTTTSTTTTTTTTGPPPGVPSLTHHMPTVYAGRRSLGHHADPTATPRASSPSTTTSDAASTFAEVFLNPLVELMQVTVRCVDERNDFLAKLGPQAGVDGSPKATTLEYWKRDQH